MRYETAGRLGLPLAGCILMLTPALATDPSRTDAADPGMFLSPAAPGSLMFVGEKLAEWNVVLGGGALIAPKYEGSDEFDVQPIPFVTATLGEHVKVDPREVSVNLYSLGALGLSGQVGYDTGRKEDDSDHLRGLGDIDVGGVVGATLTYEMGPAEFYGSLERIIGGSDGMQARLGVKLAHEAGRFHLSADLSTTWADENYMEAYFGVTPLQAARSGLPQYEIGAGFKRVDLDLSATYAVTEHWLVRGEIGLGYLLGDVADSPVVQEAFQPSAMVLIGYRF
ncbi:MipA/OmpV family protein [Ancylobacter sp. A5.8]|uniref:MipA/OmpV family protein n=1 Tax=Ancylobacter gelatini TaxID=2919920 RepID=UPI001F4E57AA|nr:MipA/OmpV family protein [Ancylobacter gelatini]MCJ8141360.1 MipA/OmpV family protein [Ancylobacter gelatini]